ncbi:BQ2448_2435 [Microbotryum intermedium]|uniref:BQ2448_2435 protein n=1 Tax=Microbotryum intermedium TaxID=269621 RepID=A0A238F889_9BASI|nr:BQ2448_2435 [Microbotryum intermedium]
MSTPKSFGNAAVTESPYPFAYDQVIMIGDSITQGAFGPGGPGTALVHRYTRIYDVLNRGFGGYNSAWCLELAQKFLPRPASAPQVRLLTVWLGANDCVSPGSAQHISQSEFQENFRSLVSLARSLPSPPEIVLITCPPFSSDLWEQGVARRGIVLDDKEERTAERAAEYAELVRGLGKELGLPVVDAYEAIERVALEEGKVDSEKYIKYMPDGLHPNELGYAIVTKGDQPTSLTLDGNAIMLALTCLHRITELEKVIQTTYPKLFWDTLPHVFPPWDQVPKGALGTKFLKA